MGIRIGRVAGKLLLTIASVLFLASAISAGTCTVNSGTTYQTISGFGGCSHWVESKVTASLATQFWADDNVNGHAGLSIIRIGIAPQGSGSWSTEYNSAKQALAINPNIRVFASPWSPPASYKNNNSTTGNNAGNTGTNPGSNTNQLATSHYGDYANYLVNFVNTCKTNGVNLYALSVQNEPDYDTSYDSCVWSNTAMHTFIGNNLGPALQTAGYTNIIMMPESFACNMGMSDPTMSDANSAKYVKVIGEHLYGANGGSGNPNPLPASYSTTAGHPVEIWETEYSMKTSTNDITSGIYYANSLHKCVVDNNYNAWIYWWLVLSSGSDDEGLCDASGNPTKRLYTLGNYSKFIKPGAVRVACTENPSTNVSASAYIDSNLHRLTIVCINSNSSGQSTTFNLTGINTSSVVPWITDASNNLVQQTAITVSGNSFTFNLPANSVMSFVGSISVGPSPTQTPYAGTPTKTATATATPSSIMLDDMEDGDTTNNWGGNWYSYSGTGTTITPKPFNMTAGGMTGSANYRAEIQATVADYAGLGTNLDASQGAVDLTLYTSVQFYVKGNGGTYWFQLTQPSITDGDCFGMTFTAPAAWTLVTIPLDGAQLGQRGFGAASTFTKNAVQALQWGSNGNGALDIQVDNVYFMTSAVISPTNTPLAPTKTNTPVIPTATGTYTRTSTPVAPSATHTPTFTPSYTKTNTPVPPTATSTRTSTNTPVPLTPTSTKTNTPIAPTATDTSIPPSATATRTFTAVIFSPTNTPIMPSATATRTSTAVINTPTNTVVIPSATNTVVIPSATPTDVINTATPTQVIVSATNTPVIPTITLTPVMPTSTATSVPTATNTQVPPTATGTASASRTNTPVPTSTKTPVPPTATYTATKISTPSMTPTFTAISTGTPTFTPTVVWDSKFTIDEAKSYPNPYTSVSGDLNIKVSISKPASGLSVRIFTTGFRRILEIPAGSSAKRETVITVHGTSLSRLAAGTYYIVVAGTSTDNESGRSRPIVLIILK